MPNRHILHDDPERVYACPECDDPEIRRRDHTGHATVGDPADDYRCGACSATFNEPVDREWRGGGQSLLERMLERGEVDLDAFGANESDGGGQDA